MLDIGKLSHKLLNDMKIETWFENETTSTNTIAKDEATKIKSPLKVYLTNHQREGRGRNQNTWSDTGAGSVFLSSWSFSFRKNPQPILSPLVGLAIYQNLEACFPGPLFSLKAPNDILLGSEKLCGILIENVLTGSDGRCIIGVGLNVFGAPQGLDATHLSAHLEVTEKMWQSFLRELQSDLIACLRAAESENLSSDTCLELAEALRKNPLLKEPLNQVTPKGSLLFKDKKVDWQRL